MEKLDDKTSPYIIKLLPNNKHSTRPAPLWQYWDGGRILRISRRVPIEKDPDILEQLAEFLRNPQNFLGKGDKKDFPRRQIILVQHPPVPSKHTLEYAGIATLPEGQILSYRTKQSARGIECAQDHQRILKELQKKEKKDISFKEICNHCGFIYEYEIKDGVRRKLERNPEDKPLTRYRKTYDFIHLRIKELEDAFFRVLGETESKRVFHFNRWKSSVKLDLSKPLYK